jgi:hypothetical protein
VGRGQPAFLALALLFLAGCGRGTKPVVYEDTQGFRITPPPGWSERARPAAVPGGDRPAPARPSALVPLPPLGVPGAAGPEQLMARYDRLTAGRQAWLRVTSADVPASFSLEGCLSKHSPGPDWHKESGVEALLVAGQPAARVAFAGRLGDQDYLCEVVGVRKGEKVYFIAASFPAADGTAREQVRQAVAGATWR